MGLKTQWRYLAGMGGAVCLGLDYPAVAATLTLQVFKKRERRRIFSGLQVMEEAALPILNSE